MPICGKCGIAFPNRCVVGGKRRNLTKRKYCLVCSPFGCHNTRALHDKDPWIVVTGKEVECVVCGRRYVYDHRLGHSKTKCNSCMMNWKRRDRKAKAVAYKGGKCERCGYTRCLRALHFHHRDRDKKEFCLSSMFGMAWSRVIAELDKCDLICSNCHMEEEEELAMRLSSKVGFTPDERATLVQVQSGAPNFMELPAPTFRREEGDMSEPPCGWCGLRTGGNLRQHGKDCAYIQSLCERFEGVAAFVAGRDLPQWEGKKGPRKNAKHSV